jgi:hypothetical protein
MFDFGMWVLDSSVIQRKHAMEWFGKDENLETYPDWNYYGQANVIGCIWLL